MNKKINIAYLHHKYYHPYHGNYAKGLNADFICTSLYAPYFKWLPEGRLKSALLNLLLVVFFPFRKYNAVLTDGANTLGVMIKRLSFGRIKLISTQGDTQLIFYHANKLSKRVAKSFKQAINEYDLVVCTGSIQYELAKKLCPNKNNIIESFNGVSKDRAPYLRQVKYNPKSKKIISLSNLDTKDYWKIKGFDIMLDVFARLAEEYEDLEYYHLGLVPAELQDFFKKRNPEYPWERIHFVGRQKRLDKWFGEALLLLHLSRMDAFPFAVTESFCAGLPTFISTEVGTKLMYKKIPNREDFIIDINDFEDAPLKILKYLKKSVFEKKDISNIFRSISKEFTAEKAMENYSRLVSEKIN